MRACPSAKIRPRAHPQSHAGQRRLRSKGQGQWRRSRARTDHHTADLALAKDTANSRAHALCRSPLMLRLRSHFALRAAWLRLCIPVAGSDPATTPAPAYSHASSARISADRSATQTRRSRRHQSIPLGLHNHRDTGSVWAKSVQRPAVGAHTQQALLDAAPPDQDMLRVRKLPLNRCTQVYDIAANANPLHPPASSRTPQSYAANPQSRQSHGSCSRRFLCHPKSGLDPAFHRRCRLSVARVPASASVRICDPLR